MAIAFCTTIVVGLVEVVVLAAREVAQGKGSSDPALVLAGILRTLATPPFVLLNIAATALTFFGLAALLAALSPTPWRHRLRAAKSPCTAWTLVVAAATSLALSLCASRVFDLLRWGQHGALRMIADAFSEASPSFILLGVLVVGVAGGTAEEVFFRGYFQTRVVARWGRWPGIGLTAAGFSLIHLDFAQGLFAFALGGFLGWITERAGSIRPAVLAHVVLNCASVLLSVGADRAEASSVMSLVLLLATLALTLAGIASLNRRLPQSGAAPRSTSAP